MSPIQYRTVISWVSTLFNDPLYSPMFRATDVSSYFFVPFLEFLLLDSRSRQSGTMGTSMFALVLGITWVQASTSFLFILTYKILDHLTSRRGSRGYSITCTSSLVEVFRSSLLNIGSLVWRDFHFKLRNSTLCMLRSSYLNLRILI